mmetsp:Transcript_13538/g.31159  ORF Transcript_13538/g.31159 Transcript_13538/m.31159 type:complete len:214 (+) Transcript_13538:88-729(+)
MLRRQPSSVTFTCPSLPCASCSGTLVCFRVNLQPPSLASKLISTVEKWPSAQPLNLHFCTSCWSCTTVTFSPEILPSYIENGVPSDADTTLRDPVNALTRCGSVKQTNRSQGLHWKFSVIVMVPVPLREVFATCAACLLANCCASCASEALDSAARALGAAAAGFGAPCATVASMSRIVSKRNFLNAIVPWVLPNSFKAATEAFSLPSLVSIT